MNQDNSINLNYDIKNSYQGYDSTIAPFFRSFIDENKEDITSESVIPESYLINIDIINKFTNLCQDKIIENFYINNNGLDREIYIKDWTFFSIEKILNLDEMYNSNNIKNIIDLAYRYHGMGWIIVAFYYIPEKKIYFRMDGGSDGHDRIENFNKLKNIDKILQNKQDNQDKQFIDFLHIIENEGDITII